MMPTSTRSQISVSELYNKFVVYYGLSTVHGRHHQLRTTGQDVVCDGQLDDDSPTDGRHRPTPAESPLRLPPPAPPSSRTSRLNEDDTWRPDDAVDDDVRKVEVKKQFLQIVGRPAEQPDGPLITTRYRRRPPHRLPPCHAQNTSRDQQDMTSQFDMEPVVTRYEAVRGRRQQCHRLQQHPLQPLNDVTCVKHRLTSLTRDSHDDVDEERWLAMSTNRSTALVSRWSDSDLVINKLNYGNVTTPSHPSPVLCTSRKNGISVGLRAIQNADTRIVPASSRTSSHAVDTPVTEKYRFSDPMSNAPASFHQRISELVALEGQTIRWERTRKIKKKSSRDSL